MHETNMNMGRASGHRWLFFSLAFLVVVVGCDNTEQNREGSEEHSQDRSEEIRCQLVWTSQPFTEGYDASGAAFSPGGQRFVAIGGDKVAVFSTEDRDYVVLGGRLKEGHYIGVCFASESTVVARSNKGHIHVWDIDRRELVDAAQLGQEDAGAGPIACSVDGTILAAGTHHGVIELWSLGKLKRLATIGVGEKAQAAPYWTMTGLGFSGKDDEKLIGIAGFERRLYLWDIQDPTNIRLCTEYGISGASHRQLDVLGETEIVYMAGPNIMRLSHQGNTLSTRSVFKQGERLIGFHAVAANGTNGLCAAVEPPVIENKVWQNPRLVIVDLAGDRGLLNRTEIRSTTIILGMDWHPDGELLLLASGVGLNDDVPVTVRLYKVSP